MKLVMLAVLVSSLLVLGCVSTAESPTPTPTVVPTPTSVPTATATAAPTAAPTSVPTAAPTEVPTPEIVASPSPVAQAPTATITIQNFAFNPQTLNVAVGTTVIWVNNDDAEHIVASAQSAPASFFSDPLHKSDTFSVTFNHTGAYGYYCTIHRTMMGNIVVS